MTYTDYQYDLGNLSSLLLVYIVFFIGLYTFRKVSVLIKYS